MAHNDHKNTIQVYYVIVMTHVIVWHFEVIIICPDGIVIVTWILYYLSEVVVLKLAGAVLYLECRPLDLRTGAPDFAAGEYSAG